MDQESFSKKRASVFMFDLINLISKDFEEVSHDTIGSVNMQRVSHASVDADLV